MADPQPDEIEKWQVRIVRPGLPGLDRLSDLGLPRLPWMNHPIRPADIGDDLRDAMLARENMLEDVNYQKVVPNRFVVEVSEANYGQQFRPIEGQVIRQWRERLLEDLVTANSRQGRKAFRFGGRLRLEIRPAVDLKDNEARVLSRIEPDAPTSAQSPRQGQPRVSSQAPANLTPPPAARPHVAPPIRPAQAAEQAAAQAKPAPVTHSERPRQGTGPQSTPPGGGAPASAAYLELVPSGQRWSLYRGTNTIGRSEVCQIYLSSPIIQEKRLVSGQHAYIIFENGVCTLFDGSPDGRPSSNGTYVNLRRVPPSGYRLQNGDAIVLAALDPLFPRSDTPGVATLYFWTDRRS